MDNKVSVAFTQTTDYYKRVFDVFYPAHERNGFTERNQTFVFTHSYLQNNPKAFAWQEMPFCRQQHVDTLIVDNKDIIMIEAKRISAKSKEKSMIDDVKRLIDINNIKMLTKNLYEDIENKYILSLVDIWSEGKYKSDLISFWKTENFLMNEFPNLTHVASDVSLFNKLEDQFEQCVTKYALAYTLFKL